MGEIVYNENGHIIDIYKTRVQGDKDPLAAEAMAMKLSMDRALKKKMTKVEFQTDNMELVRIMNGNEDNIPKNAADMQCGETW